MSDQRLAYRPDDGAEAIGVGRTTMYKLLADGEIESIKVNRNRLIPADALHRFIERKRAEQYQGAA